MTGHRLINRPHHTEVTNFTHYNRRAWQGSHQSTSYTARPWYPDRVQTHFHDKSPVKQETGKNVQGCLFMSPSQALCVLVQKGASNLVCRNLAYLSTKCTSLTFLFMLKLTTHVQQRPSSYIRSTVRTYKTAAKFYMSVYTWLYTRSAAVCSFC